MSINIDFTCFPYVLGESAASGYYNQRTIYDIQGNVDI